MTFSYGDAKTDLTAGNDECAHCGRKLRGRFVWLEIDTRSGEFTADEIPVEFSQGAFPVGVTCAKTIVRAA